MTKFFSHLGYTREGIKNEWTVSIGNIYWFLLYTKSYAKSFEYLIVLNLSVILFYS